MAAIPVDRKHAAEFGVIEAAEDGHILAFHEKNPDAPTMPGDGERVYASMGNYVFSTRTLLRLLHDDAADENSNHDFGRDILPKLAGKSEIYAYDFQTNRIPGEPADAAPYWRDVGTIDAYYEANMDLRSVKPGAEPLQPGMAAAQHQLPRPAGQVHLRRRKPPRPGHRQHRLRRLHPFRRHGAQLACWGAECACTPARWWRTA